MPRLDSLPAESADSLRRMRGPKFGETAWAEGPPLAQRRIAIVTTAGIHRRDDSPFPMASADYRVLPRAQMNELVCTHVSPNFDRTGFAEDLNVVLPLDRLDELVEEGVIGSVAEFHYAFMGATAIDQLQGPATDLAARLQEDEVSGLLLVPV